MQLLLVLFLTFGLTFDIVNMADPFKWWNVTIHFEGIYCAFNLLHNFITLVTCYFANCIRAKEAHF